MPNTSKPWRVQYQHPCQGCGKPTEYVWCQECCDKGLAKCPHGNKAGECDACDREGDFAYDSGRESR